MRLNAAPYRLNGENNCERNIAILEVFCIYVAIKCKNINLQARKSLHMPYFFPYFFSTSLRENGHFIRI